MISLRMLMLALENRIIRTNIHADRVFNSLGVLLPSPNVRPAGEGHEYIYVSDNVTAREMLRVYEHTGDMVLFTSGDVPELDALCGENAPAVCATDMGLAELHNTLCRMIEECADRQKRLDENVSAGNAFTVLYNSGAVSGTAVIFFSGQHQIISGSTHASQFEVLSDIIDYTNNSISEDMSGIFRRADESEKGYACMSAENGTQLCMARVGIGSEVQGYLLSVAASACDGLRQSTMQTAITLGCLLEKGGAFGTDAFSFQSLAEKLLLSREQPANLDELQLYLQRLPFVPKKYMRGIILRPGAKFAGSTAGLVKECGHIFPKSNIAVLGKYVYILISDTYSSCPLTCDGGTFSALLEKYDASAVIGNPAKTTKTLRTMYLQCMKLFDIIPKVQYQDSRRYYYFERFSQYYLINLCAEYLQQELGTDDIVYLCNPGVLAVTRYDRTNKSDLRDVMFTYLMNKCSIAKTAETMYMHRNTVVYKINKIEEILGQSMDDPYLRHSLIFSCMLIRYRENYQGKSIPLDVFEKTTPQA